MDWIWLFIGGERMLQVRVVVVRPPEAGCFKSEGQQSRSLDLSWLLRGLAPTEESLFTLM